MEIVLMILWAITAPMLIWSRWNGPAWIFNAILAINTLSSIGFLIKMRD